MERTSLESIYLGKTFTSKHHFVTDELIKNGEVIRPHNLGIYLYDEEKDEKLTGFIKCINPKDLNNDNELNLIIRGINPNKNGIVYLEQAVSEGDKVYVQPVNYSDNKDYLIGKFLSYTVFIDNYEIKPKDFIFGKIYSISSKHKGFNMNKIKKVSEEEYEENFNRIFRD